MADGHAVRGTSRTDAGRDAVAAVGAEGIVADPGRLATLLGLLDGVAVVCWLMGSARGDADELAALHGTRLESLLGKLVDTHVRGFVHEARGSAPQELLDGAVAHVDRAGATFRVEVAAIRADPEQHDAWVADARAAVARTLSG